MPLKVRVRNFQSVEDAEITIDGLTVVTGTNNAGKSAFFRAIRGAFTNARGYDFVRNGKEHCQVDITFDDGKTLTWMKGKNVNTYIVNGAKPMAKVGHGIPPEARVFGIDPIVAGKLELWPHIAPQITGVSFLLHEPGSVMAEAVADVERVNQLSGALKACESDRRSAKGDLKIRREDATTLAERREVFAGLDDLVQELVDLEARSKKAEKIVKALANLEKLRQRWVQAKDAVTALEGLDEAAQALPSADQIRAAREAAGALSGATKLRQRWTNACQEVEALDGLEGVQDSLPNEARMQYATQFRKALGITVELAIRHEEARKDRDTAEQAQAALAQIDLDEKLIVRTGKFKKALRNATNLRDRYVKNRDAVADLVAQIQDQEAELEQLTTQVASMLGTYEECPTCGGGLDHVH